MRQWAGAGEADHGRCIDVRLLGQFEVRIDDRIVEMGSPKHRVLLAALALEPGRTLSVSELADAVWGSAQPDDPRRGVQLYVTRLRKVFGPRASLITTCADGYRFTAGPEQVDAGRFQEFLDEAARAAGRADAEAEAAALTKALAEWRGTPLLGVPSEVLHREVVPRLREQRLQAVERQFELGLRQGRHRELVSELTGLVAEHPLRERLWALLMIALHGSGRRTDALDAYHAVRRRLADEFGVDPGEELQAVHAMILSGRSERTHGSPAALPTVPRQMPADVPTFTGRVGELARLDALVSDDSPQPTRISVISGTAGVGKTALAAHWARRVADRFPDGQLWVNLRGYDSGQALTPAQALRRFLRALGLADSQIPLALDDLSSLYRSMMDGRRMLVVLDNASSCEQVRPLLPGAPGCLVLVTSRSQLSGLIATEDARPLVLDLLTAAEARELLARRLGVDRVNAEPEAVEEIVRLCARLPLGLVVLAARAATYPEFGLSTLAADLRAARGSLDAFASTDPATEVRAVFSWSYQALSDAAAQLFRLLGLHPGPDMTAAAVASLVGITVVEARKLVTELCSAHLLTEHAPGRYTFHDLLRAYSTELSLAHDVVMVRHNARHRLYDHYLHAAHAAAEYAPPWEPVLPAPPQPGVTVEVPTDRQQAMSWLSAEHHVLVAVIDQAASAGFIVHAQHLAWTLAEYLRRQGHWHDWAFIVQTALDAAIQTGKRAAQARSHRELARAYARLGRLDAAAAHGQLALSLSEEVGDPVGLAMSHRTYGIVAEARECQSEALDHDLQALALFHTIDDKLGTARALNSVGWSYAQVGAHEQALEYCEQALELLRALGDRQGQAATLDSLGYAHHHLGHYRQAIVSHAEAIQVFREVGDRYKEAECLTHLGDSYECAGEDSAAAAAYRCALEIFTDIQHPDAHEVRAKLENLVRTERARNGAGKVVLKSGRVVLPAAPALNVAAGGSESLNQDGRSLTLLES